MLVDGLSDTELARVFEQLRKGGSVDLMTEDGRQVHIEVEGTNPDYVHDHDWL